MKNRMLQLGLLVFFASLTLGVSLPRCDDLEKICTQAATIAARTEIRCGSTRSFEKALQANKDRFAYGDCRTVKTMRDPESFINDCLPWLEKASCELIRQGKILPACVNQFSSTGQ